MTPYTRIGLGIVVWSGLINVSAPANPALTSSVLSGSGNRSSGHTYENISSTAQPGGIQYGTARGLGGLQNYAGFMGTFILRPDLIAADGLEHELSADNDGDGLSDIEEITGSAFDPNTPTDPNAWDTSGDGISDHAHAVAGTDPTSTESFLRILDVERFGGYVILSWLARQDRQYRILYAEDSHTTPTNLANIAIGNPGTGPWQVTTNMVVIPTTGSLRSFGIEVQPTP